MTELLKILGAIVLLAVAVKACLLAFTIATGITLGSLLFLAAH